MIINIVAGPQKYKICTIVDIKNDGILKRGLHLDIK